MISKKFIYNFTSYLKDSNAYGNIYFASYFEWQGMCREEFFKQKIRHDFLKNEGVLITKTAHIDYITESSPFTKIKSELTVVDLKKLSFIINIAFYDGEKLIAKGYQKICLINFEKKIIPFPDDVYKKLNLYQE
ncbi:thioesterase family protein [Rickettsiales bacterium]|nr:thioesterase family protein [Rickettsiales bacterium]